MIITKFNHSCLLIEHQEKVILLDPGMYSTPVLDIQKIQQLDTIGITHEHFDHMDKDYIKKLVDKFPDVLIFSNIHVAEILAKENIPVITKSSDTLMMEPILHEEVWMGPVCSNVMITLFGKFSHPGDSLSFTHAADILALPITAPWGSTTWAVKVAEKIKPKAIIPIHDFQWKDDVRKGMYDRLQEYFAEKNIAFFKSETGEAQEISF